MGPVSIGLEVQPNTDGDTPSTNDAVQPTALQMLKKPDTEIKEIK